MLQASQSMFLWKLRLEIRVQLCWMIKIHQDGSANVHELCSNSLSLETESFLPDAKVTPCIIRFPTSIIKMHEVSEHKQYIFKAAIFRNHRRPPGAPQMTRRIHKLFMRLSGVNCRLWRSFYTAVRILKRRNRHGAALGSGDGFKALKQDQLFNPSRMLIHLLFKDFNYTSWNRSMKNLSKMLVNLFVGSNQSSRSKFAERTSAELDPSPVAFISWSRSVECRSAEFINPSSVTIVVPSPLILEQWRSWSRSMKISSRVLVNPLFIAFKCRSWSRSVEIDDSSSEEIKDKAKNDDDGEELTVVNKIHRRRFVFDDEEEHEEEKDLIDVVAAGTSTHIQKLRSAQMKLDLDVLSSGFVLSHASCTRLGFSFTGFSKAFSDEIADSKAFSENNQPGGSEKTSFNRSVQQHSSQQPWFSRQNTRVVVKSLIDVLIWKWIIKRYHLQNLRKRIAEMSFSKREYESPMMPLWIVRYDFHCVLHIVCVDRVHTIDKENAQHKIASGLLCSINSADKWVAIEFVSVEFVDVWEHVSEKIWIEAFCKSCWKWMHVNIEANVLGLFFRSAIGHLKEASLSEELSQLLKFVESRLQLSYGGISLMEELRRLMSQLDLKADFSEFSHFYDFVFFICCYGILWDIMQETPPSSSKRSFHGGSILQLTTWNSDKALQGSVCCLVQALNRGAKKIHVHNEQVSLMRTTADGGIQVEEASFYLTSILSWTYKTCMSSLPVGVGGRRNSEGH
nr:ABC transporter G family member 22 isoform X1 [Ipomoea batatas]